ncbi:hypothetical protein EZI54_16390 [Marinobacter halodurans]|uniref:Uncharacterized protein n=1 Tax=Marinobacter halodurans TaxID=2528979 RepID=A0ABY1ZL00_9GAMM|nr:hypothetical protein [Marinobacter halodurans]TBW52217.1 hypothetical protein EZI54_16390 [Marinobacter halodurans]
MARTFSEAQTADLKRIWSDCGGLDRLADNFTAELAYFMDRCPELIAVGNKKIETEESRNYAAVATHCEKLLAALGEIPELDRLNLLSLREERAEYDGRSVPLCDPLEYVQTMQELATDRGRRLKRYAKHKRQLDELRRFLDRFPPLNEISRAKFIDLAAALWPEINPENFLKAYRPGKK